MPKVYAVDKVVDPKHKPETLAKKEGIPQPIPLVPNLVPQPHPEASLVQHRKGQGKTGVKRKNAGCRSQP